MYEIFIVIILLYIYAHIPIYPRPLRRALPRAPRRGRPVTRAQGYTANLPENLISSELRFCLRTQNLTTAVIIWDKLQPFVKQLKHLVCISETLENHQIQQYFERIKSSMLKQLQMEHIDQLIAKREKNYNSGSHTVNALADKTCISEFDDNFINQAVNIFNVENSEELAIKLSETTQSLKSTEEKSSFVESMSSLIKGMTNMMNSDAEFDAPRPRLSNEQIELEARYLLEENDYEVNPHSGLPTLC